MKIGLLLIGIVAIGFLLRFVSLGEIPAGITSDEANTGYDAYSILLTGKDQWGIPYPLVSFKGFGDFRSPLYTYLVIPFVAFFDLAPIAVRLPSAIGGTLSIILIFFIGKKLFNDKVGLASAFFLSVSPWGVGLSRQGIESNLAMTLFLFALYLFLKIKDKFIYLPFSIFIFLITLYTYTSYILFTPIVVAVLIYRHRKFLYRKKQNLIIVSILFILGVLPLILFTSAGSTRFSQIGFVRDVTSMGIIDVLNQQVGGCYDIASNLMCRVFNNKVATFVSVFFKNYIHHFSFDFLYIKGTTTQFSLLYERGLLYSYEVIFLILGILKLLKTKKKLFVLTLLLISALPDSLSGGGHHSRASTMLPFLILFQSLGFVYLLEILLSLKLKFLKIATLLVLTFLILFSVTSFTINYFGYFKKHYSSYSLYAYQELSRYLLHYKEAYSDIFLSSYLNDAPHYIFYLFYNKYDPKKYQTVKDIEYDISDDGFISITRLENLHFTNFIIDEKLPEEYSKFQNALFIASPDAFPEGTESIKEFKSLSGGVIFQAVEYDKLK